jgi:hypothetical protein
VFFFGTEHSPGGLWCSASGPLLRGNGEERGRGDEVAAFCYGLLFTCSCVALPGAVAVALEIGLARVVTAEVDTQADDQALSRSGFRLADSADAYTCAHGCLIGLHVVAADGWVTLLPERKYQQHRAH